MKITRHQLKKVIKEEILNLMEQQELDRYDNEIWYDDGVAYATDKRGRFR